MKVLWSIAAKLGAAGIGTTGYHAARGLYRRNMLRRVLCGSFLETDIPSALIRPRGLPDMALRRLALYDPTQRVWHLERLLFDRWVARHLEPADLLQAWGGSARKSLDRAKRMGMITAVQRGSPHPLFQDAIVAEEHVRWGQRWRRPERVIRDALAEIDAADYVLVQSDFTERTYLERGVPREKLIQIRYGADTVRHRPAIHRSRDRFRVVYVGQVGLRKGVPYLLEAWRRLGWADAELWLAGNADFGMRPLLDRYASVPGVRLLGHVSDTPAVYQQSDVFALPSLSEGGAKVVLEALASGLPIVTTANAGSVVEDGVQGFVLPIRDADAIARALERLRSDEGLRRDMGRASRVLAETQTWERYEEELATTLRRLGEVS